MYFKRFKGWILATISYIQFIKHNRQIGALKMGEIDFLLQRTALSWFVNEVSSWRPLMLRPFLTSARTDRSPTYVASINKSVGYRSRRRRRRSPSHDRVDQDQPPYSLQYESRNIRKALHGKAAWWFAHPTALRYCRPSKCPCVI